MQMRGQTAAAGDMRRTAAAGTVRLLRFLWVIGAAVLLIADPAAAAEGVRAGLELSARSVIPSLFPFLVLAPMLTYCLQTLLCRGKLGGMRAHTAALLSAWAVGMTAGFPVGALMLVSLCERGVIAREEAGRYLGICTGASPAFLIGYFGQALWGSAVMGIGMWGMQCAVGLCAFLFLRWRYGGSLPSPAGNPRAEYLQAVFLPAEHEPTLAVCLRDAVPRMLGICGAVVFFSVFRVFLCRFLPASAAAVTGGFAEMTGGLRECRALYEGGSLGREGALVLSAAMIGFGGGCVGMQTADAASRLQLPMRSYWLQRVLLGAVYALAVGVTAAVKQRI